MTEPLIDRDKLEDALAVPLTNPDLLLGELTTAVLEYLREVLTPEVLEMELIRVSACGADGADFHRRIFGEDQ